MAPLQGRGVTVTHFSTKFDHQLMLIKELATHILKYYRKYLEAVTTPILDFCHEDTCFKMEES